jgi:crotonobetainyl-CoA:carnitine CoA-transferase CaiB-like acyl-CoA transferase
VAPVKTAADAIEDPQTAALDLLDDDDGVRFARTPLSQFNFERLCRAPRLGEHSAAVLAGLGLEAEELAELSRAGVVETGGGHPDKHTTLELASHANT